MANTLFGMMNSSATGLMASQIGINISGNNIQNINTLGYTRQRALFTSNNPIYYKDSGWLGTGVSTSDIQRLRDSYLDVHIRDETSVYERMDAKREMIGSLESVIAESSSASLTVNLDDLWDSWVELSKTPGNSTLQTLVKENSIVVADKFKELSVKIDNVAKEAATRKDDAISEARDIIKQINDLNTRLKKLHDVDPNSVPNEIIDTRDLLTEQLSSKMGINVTINGDYTVSVDVRLQDGSTVDALSLDKAGIEGIVDKIQSGSIRGYHEAETQITTKYQGEFGIFAEALATEINAIQGFDFFVFDPANPAGTIEVNPGLLDGTLSVVTGATGSVNDNSVALQIIALRDKKVMIGGEMTTFGQFHKDLIASIGVETKQATDGVKNQVVVLEHLNSRYESLSGINLDEEMINLTQFQAAYDANARVISTITEMLDTILNMGV